MPARSKRRTWSTEKGSAVRSGLTSNSVSGETRVVRTSSAARSRRARSASRPAMPPPAMTTCRGMAPTLRLGVVLRLRSHPGGQPRVWPDARVPGGREAAAMTPPGRRLTLAAAALAAVLAGIVLYAVGEHAAADAVWSVLTAVILVPLTVDVARSLAHGRLGVDVIALVAMAGALALGEAFAGAVIALMLSGGNALEEVAASRARRELTAL